MGKGCCRPFVMQQTKALSCIVIEKEGWTSHTPPHLLPKDGIWKLISAEEGELRPLLSVSLLCCDMLMTTRLCIWICWINAEWQCSMLIRTLSMRLTWSLSAYSWNVKKKSTFGKEPLHQKVVQKICCKQNSIYFPCSFFKKYTSSFWIITPNQFSVKYLTSLNTENTWILIISTHNLWEWKY